jgi:hypothetical protein
MRVQRGCPAPDSVAVTTAADDMLPALYKPIEVVGSNLTATFITMIVRIR